jgi:catechol 2,3-dioxygenase-like lactoylglutathione lyase family enzyme
MPGIQIHGFNHTGVVVSDLDRAIGFFRDLLGFELLSRAPREPGLIGRITGLPQPKVEIAHLQGPGHRVELIRYATDGIRDVDPPRVYDDGAAHIAIDVEDVDGAMQASAAHGLEPVGEIVAIDAGPNRGRKVVYLQSPYGCSSSSSALPPDRSEGGGRAPHGEIGTSATRLPIVFCRPAAAHPCSGRRRLLIIPMP